MSLNYLQSFSIRQTIAPEKSSVSEAFERKPDDQKQLLKRGTKLTHQVGVKQEDRMARQMED
jgi:hypothetical protein